MRILHIINVRWFNATAWYAYRLAEEGINVGDHAALAGLASSPVIIKAKEEGIPVFEGISNSNNPFKLLKSFYNLLKFIKKYSPNVIVSHRGEAFFLIALYKFFFLKNIKLIRVRGDVRPPKSDIISRFTHNSCCDKIITPNRFMQENYKKLLRTPEKKLKIIYGGVNRKLFKPDKKKRDLIRKEFGFKEEDFVVSVAGRFDPVKGHEIFLKACGILYKQGMKNLKIFLIGFPENISNDEILAMAERNGVRDITFITGKRPDIEALLNACDLGVISSIGSEAICRVAMEFMAVGVLVVASDAGVLPEMFPAESLYPMFNEETLAQRIKNTPTFIEIYDGKDFYIEFKKACLN